MISKDMYYKYTKTRLFINNGHWSLLYFVIFPRV